MKLSFFNIKKKLNICNLIQFNLINRSQIMEGLSAIFRDWAFIPQATKSYACFYGSLYAVAAGF